MAKHLVAAYLNALKAYTPPGVLDVLRTQAIWASFVDNTFYEPTAGIKWYAPELIAWLKTTMPN